MSAEIAAPAAVARTLAAIRARAPLVHNITNVVVANVTANALLALGASPAMVQAEEEVAGFAAVADALVINLGTITAERAAAMRIAAKAARAAGKPWALDPVAVGALAYRTGIARELLALGPTAIRGNASEIMSLAGTGGAGRGVDTSVRSDTAREAARTLATNTGAVVAVTGAIDYVTDGVRMIAIANGHPMMTRVTGTGCIATAVLGACIAVEADPVAAAAHALTILGIAGEAGASRAHGPGSLQIELLDVLYQLDEAMIMRRARLSLVGAASS